MINYNLLQASPAQQAGMPKTQVMQEQPDSTLKDLSGLLTGLSQVFGTNTVQKANKDVTAAVSGGPVTPLAQSLLPPSAAAKMPQSQNPQAAAAQGSVPGQIQSPTSALQQQLSPDALKPMVENAFPNDPVRQQLAMAQASHESGLLSKPSQLASQYNNLYGVKGQGSAGQADMKTTEYVNGVPTTTNAGFAAYKSPQDSVDAYKKLLQNPRYSEVMKAPDLKSAAEAAQKAGYATDPHYADKVVSTYNKLQTSFQAHTSPTPQNVKGQPISDDMQATPAYQSASNSYVKAAQAGITKSPYYVSVDYSQPEGKNLSVINGRSGEVVYQAQAKANGDAKQGTFLADQTYDDKGYNTRLRGLDKGVNQGEEIKDDGKGDDDHNFGAFTVPKKEAPKLINLMKGGTIVHTYNGQLTPGGIRN